MENKGKLILTELNRLTNLIHTEIREFRISRFKEDVQEACKGQSIWKLANRIKGSRTISNTPIQGRGGVIFDVIGKATAVAECLEDQFTVNTADDRYRQHYKQVRRGVQLFRNTSFNSSIEPVSGNEVKKIIKTLEHSKTPGYNAVTNSMIKQLPCHCVSHLVTIYNSALRLHTTS